MAAPVTCHVRWVSLPAVQSTTDMACVLKAELKCKDGSRREFTVQAERELKSLTEAVKTISSDLSVALTALVDEERSARADRGDSRAHDEEEEEDDGGDDDEEEEGATTEAAAVKKLNAGPPPKRLKTVTPS